MEKGISSLAELKEEAWRFAAGLSPVEGRATLVTLSGELGAGKTAFTQEVARSLGVTETVTSPTFVLLKNYVLPTGGKFRNLVHVDAYRLTGGRDLAALRFKEVLSDSRNLIMLEWPDHLPGALPNPDVHIRLSVHSNGMRTIAYE